MQQEAQHTEQEASGGNLALQPVTLVLVGRRGGVRRLGEGYLPGKESGQSWRGVDPEAHTK